MKKFLISLNIVIWSLVGYQVSAYAAETKRVCTEVVEKGKTVEKCRTVKIHKKHEGTVVPEKAPAKKPAGKPEPKK